MNRLRYEPAVIAAVIGAAFSLAITFGLHMTAEQEGLTMAVVTAILGIITAFTTSNGVLSALLGLVKAAVALAVGYGLHLNADQAGGIITLSTLAIGLFGRTQNSPKGGASAGVSLR